MTSLVRGIDVSQYQPSGFDWVAARDHRITFAYVRATYGTKRDPLAIEHVRHARDAGITVGLYHFFRPDQSVEAQGSAFRAVAEICHLGAGDLLPAVDVEAYPVGGGAMVQPRPQWCAALQELLEGLRSEFGGAVVYITAADWTRLGKPAWLLDYPLWVAHWPAPGRPGPVAAPTTPGGAPWRIWQHLVGQLGSGMQAPAARGAVDQDVATLPLPTIGVT